MSGQHQPTHSSLSLMEPAVRIPRERDAGARVGTVPWRQTWEGRSPGAARAGLGLPWPLEARTRRTREYGGREKAEGLRAEPAGLGRGTSKEDTQPQGPGQEWLTNHDSGVSFHHGRSQC